MYTYIYGICTSIHTYLYIRSIYIHIYKSIVIPIFLFLLCVRGNDFKISRHITGLHLMKFAKSDDFRSS